jgi:hypothetical protein
MGMTRENKHDIGKDGFKIDPYEDDQSRIVIINSLWQGQYITAVNSMYLNNGGVYGRID